MVDLLNTGGGIYKSRESLGSNGRDQISGQLTVRAGIIMTLQITSRAQVFKSLMLYRGGI
jgi:hypothetical protein